MTNADTARGTFAVLIEKFRRANKDARDWERAGRVSHEFPDCDVMSRAFTAFARAEGYGADTIKVGPPSPEPWYGDHWFTVIDGIGIDWTARQFYNVAEDMTEWIDPIHIPVPLIFAWPGEFPVPGVTFTQLEIEV